MSVDRESIVLILLANFVLSIVVVFGAIALVGDGDEESSSAPSQLAERVHALERNLASDPGEEGATDGDVDKLTVGNRLTALEAKLVGLEERVAALAAAPRAVAADGTPVAGSPGAGEDEPSPANAMMKFVGKMMEARMERERDRYIEMLQNPTPESEKRQEERFRGMARWSARNLGLDARQTELLEQIVVDVDQMRRDRFRALINSKSDPSQITREEVEGVLQDSFEEEDRRVSQALPREKADQYKREANGMREMMVGVAGTMFEKDGTLK